MKVLECRKCSRWAYDADMCPSCQKREARFNRLKREWRRLKRKENLTLRDGILFCLRRKVRYVSEMADVLGVDYRDAHHALDMLQRDAR